MDVSRQLDAVERSVSIDALDARTVRVARTCPAPVGDVWSALTESEHLAGWLAPVTGDLRPGGRYQLEGNAGGEVLACDPRQSLSVTWEFDGETTRVDVHLTEEPEGTRVQVTHTGAHDPAKWEAYGPGAVGIGWEMALLALCGRFCDDDTDWVAGPEGVALVAGSGTAWGEAATAAGADPDDAREAAQRCVAAYTAPAPADD